MNSVADYYTPSNRQPTAVPELQNYQPHQSFKVMLKVILNRLKPQANEIIAEEQAGFRARRSTTEQIFNFKVLYEKISNVSRICTMSSLILKSL